MKPISRYLFGCLLLTLPCSAQKVEFECLRTQKVLPTDSPEIILEKAAHVVPTANQWAALNREFIAFVHFGPNTFTRKEWGTGMEDPSVFALRQLDTDQWCQALKAAGMTMVVITAKHHDGFVLWQSRYTRHGIMSTGFRDGKGDVLKDLSASCRKYGLKMGVYLSPADLYQIEHPQGLYGNLSRYTWRTIPREVPGRPFQDQRKFRFLVDDYNEYYLNQLFELLTEYGPIHEVWLDGAHPKRKGGQTYNYKAWKELIHTLAPEAVVFGREDVRWCGNEAGATRETEWNVVAYDADPDTLSHFADMTDTDLGSRKRLASAAYLHYQQAETNTSIREGWFYRDDSLQQVRSADDVFDIYERSVGGNSTFMLNVPPNRDGRFSPADVAVLRETGRRIRATYGRNLLGNAQGPRAVLDNNPDTYLELKGLHPQLEITLKQPATLNRLLLQEAIRTHSERVERFAVDAWTDGGWKEVAQATNIGYKRIVRFPDVTTDRLRIRLLESRGTPAISTISAHYYAARPPQLTIARDAGGTVSIAPQADRFGWKRHGQNATENLRRGYTIHYTTDGSAPSRRSAAYTAPFRLEKGTVRAVAVLHGEEGSPSMREFGLAPGSWKQISASSARDGREARLAADANESTCWTSAPDDRQPSLTADLGRSMTLTGLAYTPPKGTAEGLMAEGRVMVSTDGQQWQEAGRFTFGNLKNDPTRRDFRLTRPVTARFVRIECTRTESQTPAASIAELELFVR